MHICILKENVAVAIILYNYLPSGNHKFQKVHLNF